MKVNYHHGPSIQDSRLYEIGPYTLDEAEALELAYTILGHYRPRVMGQLRLQNQQPPLVGTR